MPVAEHQVTAAIRTYGLKKTLESYLTVNNSRIFAGADAWEDVHDRSTIIDAFMKEWMVKMVRETLGYDPVEKGMFPFNFAFLAVGGYGRSEMNPNSDVDIRLIIDDTKLQENPLVQRYKDDIYNDIVKKEYGFAPDFSVHNLNDLQGFTEADLNHFLDMRLLYGNRDLVDTIYRRFKEQCDAPELFLHHAKFLEELREKYPQSFNDAEGFNIKFGIGGLRNFHTAIWIEAAKSFSSCREIYARAEVPESVYDAAGILLNTRSWLNLRKEQSGPVKKPHTISADTFTFEDTEALSPASRERLLFARREVYRFAESLMKERIRKGVRITPNVVLHYDGMCVDGLSLELNAAERNSLFFSLYHTSHRRGVPISPIMDTTLFKNTEQWVRPHPLFVQLFYEKGSLSTTLKRLSDAHCLGKLIPGYSNLEAGLHGPGHRARHLTRAGFALQKIATLEDLVGEQSLLPNLKQEYEALSADASAALKLALLSKRIPLHEKAAGEEEQSIQEYLKKLEEHYPSFPREALEMAGFLMNNHELFNQFVVGSLNDASTVRRFKRAVRDKEHLQALYLFTHADYGFPLKENAAHWDNVDELYRKTMGCFLRNARKTPYDPKALDEVGKTIAEDLGPDFMSGRYAQSAMSWISYLRRVHESGRPMIRPYLNQENVIGIACRDYPGLLAVITGTLYDAGANVNQAHAYSLSEHKLVLDMFDFTPGSVPQKELVARLEENIQRRTMIGQSASEILAPLKKNAHVEYRKSSGYYALSFTSEEDKPGIMYALTRILYEKLNANIYGLQAYSLKGKPVNDYVFFKTSKNPAETAKLVKEYFA